MEVMKNMSPVVKEERRAEAAGGEEAGGDIVKFETEASFRHDGQRSNASSPEQKNFSMSKQDEQLESTRAEMGEVKQENERLKMVLARIVKDYQSLQMHFFDIVHQDSHQKRAETSTEGHQEAEESELVSLSLGASSGGPHKTKEEKDAPSSAKPKVGEQTEQGLSLSLDCNFDNSSSPGEPQQNSSRENSSEDQKEGAAGEPWPPSKVLKTLRSEDDEVSQHAHVKKARVSVRARCDAPTMNDGCQWRKYGQKTAKGNPCPRAYYRCTAAPACPVRKQVQRCAEDMSILITTYEGSHNHPLPMSATAMASATSAAACMLMSGSSASRPAIGAAAMTGAATIGSTTLHGLNFGLSDASRQRQFYLPTPSITSPPSHPTITLDLTSPPSSSSPSAQFSRFPSNFSSGTARYGPSGFSFSTSEASNTPASWSGGYLSYGSTPPYNTRNQLGYLNLWRQPQEQLYQSYLQKAANSAPPQPNPQSLTDTIAVATKAIASDPSFQSALAAAITSIVGGQGTHGSAETAPLPGQANLRWGEQLSSSASPFTSPANGNGCASTFLSRSTSSNANPQQATLLFPQPPLGISSSKSASASPIHSREQIN